MARALPVAEVEAVRVGSHPLGVEVEMLPKATPLTTKALTVLVLAVLADLVAVLAGMLVAGLRFKHH
jgi:hypothetical protein